MPSRLSLTQVLIFGAAVVTLSMGIRHGFGLWLQPITMERGWTRETFGFAIAIQNLAWGLCGPIAGMVADRFGAFLVLLVGGLMYASGLVLMALATSGLAFTGSAGVLIGMAQAGTTYAIVFGVIVRNVAPEKRSWAMGVAAAAGSFGQFLMVPVENWLIGEFGWQNALFVLGFAALLILPLAFGLREPAHPPGTHGAPQSVGSALREAFAQAAILAPDAPGRGPDGCRWFEACDAAGAVQPEAPLQHAGGEQRSKEHRGLGQRRHAGHRCACHGP